MIDDVLGSNHSIHVAFNPEFLKEGYAVKDCTKPDRVVLGFDDGGKYMTFEYRELMRLYTGIMDVKKENIVCTDIRSAEMVKYASNAMLATRISFINEIANLCEAVGANIDDVSKCVGLDSRIGPKFLKAGCGYGGSCFPKDVKALMNTAEENGQNMLLLSAVDAVNELQKDKPYEKYMEYFKDQPAKKACVLGLAFKPGTDDMREAPSINLIEDLLSEGVEVVACDPVAIPNAKNIFGDEIGYEQDPYKAAIGADVVFIITEWEEYRKLDLNVLKSVMRGDVFIDGRGLYKREDMDKIFKFDRIG
jgi:UDPglucose 6-dehydrogenase